MLSLNSRSSEPPVRVAFQEISRRNANKPLPFHLYQVVGISTDSHFSHNAWATTPRSKGGLGPDLKMALVADKTMSISRDYGVLIEEEGIALRGLFIIDPKGILRQITVNDLPVGRSVDETLRLIKAFQFAVGIMFLVDIMFPTDMGSSLPPFTS